MDDGSEGVVRGDTLPRVTGTSHPPTTPNDRRVLRPGVVVLAHPPDRLVVAHDHGRVVAPESTSARRLLDRLTAGGASPPSSADPPDAWRLWRRLDDAHLLVAAAARDAARGVARRASQHGRAGPGLAAADAAVLALGDEAAGALRGRVAATTVLRGPDALRAPATAALAAARVPMATSRRGIVHLLLGDVMPDPADVADAMRGGMPHLPVLRDVSGVTVGPFVVPGHTACTGCLEAARADHDPDQGLVRLLRARRLREVQLPADPAVLALALAVAARDLTVWAAGGAPSTWSATRTFTHGGGEERVDLPRHPRCGCAWDALGEDAG